MIDAWRYQNLLQRVADTSMWYTMVRNCVQERGMFSKEMILTLFASISSSYTHFARPLRRQGHEVPVAIHCLGTSSVGCGRVCTDHGCAGLGPSHPTRRDTAIAAVRVALLPL